MNKIRILLADDHTVMRSGLRALLERQADFEVVGEAADGRQAVEMAEKLTPDVVVVDVAMPRLNGLGRCATDYREVTAHRCRGAEHAFG